jgi:hypothetical protein
MLYSIQIARALCRMVELRFIQSSTSLHMRSRARAQLKSKIARKLVAKEQQARRRNLARHVPDAAAAVFRVLTAMAADGDGARPPGPKRARLAAAEDLLGPVRRGEARASAALDACVQQLVTLTWAAKVKQCTGEACGCHAQQLQVLFRRPACTSTLLRPGKAYAYSASELCTASVGCKDAVSLTGRTRLRCGRWWRPRWRASSRSMWSASTRTWRAPPGAAPREACPVP